MSQIYQLLGYVASGNLAAPDEGQSNDNPPTQVRS